MEPKQKVALLIVLGAVHGGSSPAWAQLWNPLDTVPKPNVVLAQDTSVTMAIDTTCSSCHLNGSPATRLNIARTDILDTMPLIRDYFVFGAFKYDGCGWAKVTARVLPDIANPDTSYEGSRNLLQSATTCGSSETQLPGGVAPGGCLTPTTNCSGDLALAEALLNGGLPGLNPFAPFKGVAVTATPAPSPIGGISHFRPRRPPPPPPPPPAPPPPPPPGGATSPPPASSVSCSDGPSCARTDVLCDDGTSYLIEAAFTDKIQRIDWPRWSGAEIYEQEVNLFCDKLVTVYDEINNELAACTASPPVMVDYSVRNDWCNATTIATNACQPGSILENSCVCDPANPLCVGNGGNSACGIPLVFKARQQVAVCETNDRSAPDRFGSVYLSQPDNVVNNGCRENVAVFLTDGYMGGSPGTIAQIYDVRPAFSSGGGINNMAVFHVSNVFEADADAMMSAMSDGRVTTAYSATNALDMQASFARTINRIYKGVYTGAASGMDRFGTRVAYHAFTVPGYGEPPVPVSDTYFGWPARISWHAVDATGAVDPNPIWETDWQQKVNGPSFCPHTALGQTWVDKLGPGGQFRSAVPREAHIPANAVDRNGDGNADNHPNLRWGNMFSVGATRPLVVGAPREAPTGQFAQDFWTHATDVRERPEMVYVMSNGYLHGIVAGEYSNAASTFGTQRMDFGYDDGSRTSGVEILRYGPSWVDDPHPNPRYNFDVNDLIQQPIITGQLFASEQRLFINNAYRFRTVLVGAQGKTGPGLFTLDVSDPCNAQILREWKLPGNDTASGEPTIYTVRTPNGLRPMVITTGGLGGSSTLYAFDVVGDPVGGVGGVNDFSVALPAAAGRSYPTAPVCVDVTGEGNVTHCYALRDDGHLIRARVDVRAFTDVEDITPQGFAGGGLVFSTSPAVFFGADGAVNLVYGSGDHQRLTTPGGQNNIYKVIDRGTRQRNVPTLAANLDRTCRGASTSGLIPLPPGERVISPPVVAKGVVAWTTYRATSSGCVAGTSRLYAMDFDSCADAAGTGPRPQGVDIGEGLPASPVLHRGSQTLLVSTSAGPTGAQTEGVAVRTRGGTTSLAQKVFWRLESDVR